MKVAFILLHLFVFYGVQCAPIDDLEAVVEHYNRQEYPIALTLVSRFIKSTKAPLLLSTAYNMEAAIFMELEQLERAAISVQNAITSTFPPPALITTLNRFLN